MVNSFIRLVEFAIENKVRTLVEEKIADREDLFLVGVKMHPNGKLEVLVDGDNGISIQDCAAISRHVGFHLEEEDAISHAYRLEVSSPGIDTPFALDRQYRKNVGRMIQLKLQDGAEKEGKLLEVADGYIIIMEKIKEKGKKAVEHQSNVPFGSIKTAKVLISFK
ncbi:ribosome assembly cofactor RimP [Parapedobacter koreensis]|uniref:Ribosome maturation factor RimP n=1 Tax=Parapedobacter koreensis TaxID=332977 RepID=A0A1H7LZJ0_9SPHI|nr:ribosome assembly cofactor RimP [Parapedobacter koreensis]SEL04383.1 ribosome maturation factor RimP [Parapedobacter koreensis]